MKEINKYLQLFPEQDIDIKAARYLWGDDLLIKIIRKAFRLKKKIKFMDPRPDFCDLLEYEFANY
jgi:hypothetical protein